MAWGISPRKIAVIPLNEYSADHYLTLIYHAFNNLGWRIGYFNNDGIIAYTNISWASYAEEVSVHIVNNQAIIKSECVGYQGLFTDYEKNEKNLELLYGEITYVEYHLQQNLQETTQQLMDNIPDRQFISFDNPPLGYKEKLHSFLSAFTPTKGYTITPVLVLSNIAVYLISMVIMVAMVVALSMQTAQHPANIQQNLVNNWEDIYLSLGFGSRTQVLSGQVWRLVTNTFLHFSVMHIAGNMIVLIYIGSLVEGKLGKWNYLFIYLLTGVCASITSVIWHDQGISAGASGAIFGLFGVLLALLSTTFYETNARRALLISTTIFVAYNIIPIGRQIDHAAHFSGLISGYAFGWIAYWGIKYQKQNLVAAAALLITVVYTSTCIWLAPIYELKELQQLSDRTQKLSIALANDFYRNYELTHDQRLAMFKNKALPEIDSLRKVGIRIDKLSLPKKQKQIATIKSKIIFEECKLYTLIYKEFIDNDRIKYRNEINSATEKINVLRTEWGEIDESSD
jgi:rhomboid protease GluP